MTASERRRLMRLWNVAERLTTCDRHMRRLDAALQGIRQHLATHPGETLPLRLLDRLAAVNRACAVSVADIEALARLLAQGDATRPAAPVDPPAAGVAEVSS